MREIKFRMWRLDKMQNVCSLHFNREAKLDDVILWPRSEQGNDAFSAYPGEGILMQFTGFHDRDGKPIFEGDIVVVQDMFTRRDTYRGVVEWDSDLGKWNVGIGKIRWGGGWFSVSEIIGNIHENPELLERKL